MENKENSRREFIQQATLAGTGLLLASPLQLFSNEKNVKTMKYIVSVYIVLTCFLLSSASCNTDKNVEPTTTQTNNTSNQTNGTMKITIGSSVYSATLYDNATTKAFKAMLPMTLNMSELNGNEKYFYFSNTLPTNSAPGGNIQNGDLMLYGDNCLVLFYESLNTTYNYTRLGKISNPNGLASALGTGNITIKFELE